MIAILCFWLLDKLLRFAFNVGPSAQNVASFIPFHPHSLCVISIQLDTRRILKRLAKENLKQLGRMVAKLAHANPMTVLRTIIHQVLI